jgi:hypothetical protein
MDEGIRGSRGSVDAEEAAEAMQIYKKGRIDAAAFDDVLDK